MKVSFEHNDGYTYESTEVATYDEAMEAVRSEAAGASEYAKPEDVPNIFPIRWDIGGHVPTGEKSYGYISETGDIF